MSLAIAGVALLLSASCRGAPRYAELDRPILYSLRANDDRAPLSGASASTDADLFASVDARSQVSLPIAPSSSSSIFEQLRTCLTGVTQSSSVEPWRYQYVPRALLVPRARGFVPETTGAIPIRFDARGATAFQCVPFLLRNSHDRNLSTVMLPALWCGDEMFGWALHGFHSHNENRTEIPLTDMFVANGGYLTYASIGMPIRLSIDARTQSIFASGGRVFTVSGLVTFDLRRWFPSVESCERALSNPPRRS